MEMRKVMKKQFKIAACFFLLAVLLRVADACQQEHQTCTQNPDNCCSGLVCIEVSTGVFECEPEECEDHVNHDCQIGIRECCDPDVCTCDPVEDCVNCKCKSCTLQYGQTCDPDGSECCQRRAECNESTKKCQCPEVCTLDCHCCVGADCTNGACVCRKDIGDPCDPNAPVHECCGNECVQVSVGVYQCQDVGI